MYFDENGKPSAYPVGLEAAYAEKAYVYNCGYLCGHCELSPYRYVRTGYCHACARLDALDFFNLARGSAQPEYKYGQMWKVTLPRRSYRHLSRSSSEKIRHALTLIADPAHGFNVVSDACEKGGHVGLKLSDGKCYYCMKGKPHRLRRSGSPRQKALKDGKAWYRPNDPCKRCGQRLMRRVANGQCECYHGLPKQATRRQEVRDTIGALYGHTISRKDALALGLAAYCPDGCQWRYTSCGNPVRGHNTR